MTEFLYSVVTAPGLDPHTAEGKPTLPPLEHSVEEIDSLCIERNIAIPLRDGTRIYSDLYRPVGTNQDLPILLAWGPYGKHNQKDHLWPTADIEPGWLSEFTGFEAPDPVFWCRNGYAVVYVDPRGMWHSEGNGVHNGPQEADDVYDAIEWLAAQSWSNGRVGMLGVSYLAGIQYIAAATAPPSLKAISPWECFSDWYREFCYHGGIPETGFIPRASRNMRYSLSYTEDTAATVAKNPFVSDYYRSRYPDLSKITVPAFVVASWSDHGLHTRGTLAAYEQMSSTDKWLLVHGQKKWRYFYDPENVKRQLTFFDYYLLDRGAGPRSWPKVELEVHDDAESFVTRTDIPWPIPQRVATRLYADFSTQKLCPEVPANTSSVTFDPMVSTCSLEFEFTEATHLVGPMRLRLVLQADEAEDADVFVAIRKFSSEGNERRFAFNALFNDGPVALGWLRASHQDLDLEQSWELQPVHKHTSEHPLEVGKPKDLDIEVWPAGVSFEPGEKLVITILGRDFVERASDLNSPVIRHTDTRNTGTWTLHSSSDAPSYISLPLYNQVA